MKVHGLIPLTVLAGVLYVASQPLNAPAPPPRVAAVSLTPAVHAGVVVNDPSVLPPPGHADGWVDQPCSKQVHYNADWYYNGQHVTGTAAEADSMIVSDIGTPTMVTDGSDVVTTFSATLHAKVTTLGDVVLHSPETIDLPGQMSVRLVGKAGKVTGSFFVVIEALAFSTNSLSVKLDPTRRSSGAITVTALGGGSYAVECGVDVYSMFSLKPDNPPQWLPFCPDVYAPTHYELLGASCPPADALAADFACSPPTPANGKPVTFTDLSTGGATSWSWTFGDGTGSGERNPSHSYAAPGFYPVRLVVTNGGAASSKSAAIRVGPLWGHGGPRPRRELHGVPVAGTSRPATP